MHETLEDTARAKDRRSGRPADETWAQTTNGEPSKGPA